MRSKTFAIADARDPTKVALWCDPVRKTKRGVVFDVLNGGWRGRRDDDGKVYVYLPDGKREDTGRGTLIVWEGVVPDSVGPGYEGAIAWIEEQLRNTVSQG